MPAPVKEPTTDELKAQVNLLTQQRNTLSGFNLDWELRYAVLSDAHQKALARIEELEPK